MTAACTLKLPAKTAWVVEASAATSTASVISPEPSLTASRAAISRASRPAPSSTAAGASAATTWASASALGATRYSASAGSFDRQHAGGAELAQPCRRGLRTLAQHDGDRVADAPGEGQQLQRGLG